MKGFLFCRMGVGLLWRRKKGVVREPKQPSDARGAGKRGRAGTRSAV